MRIPILFGTLQTEPDAAWLVETGQTVPVSVCVEYFAPPSVKAGHLAGCLCCTPRGPAAEALTRLFRARATGAAPFFKTVIVLASAAGEAAVREAVNGDLLIAAPYRLADGIFK